MQTESASPPKLIASPVSVTNSEEDYLQWIRRFDMLWSSPACEHAQNEMQALIRLIEQYENTHQPGNTLFTRTPIQGDIS